MLKLLSWLGLTPRVFGLMQVNNRAFGKEDTPDVPSYAGAAEQTGQQSVYAAIINQLLNRPNETTPFGSRTWEQTGSQNIGGYNVPTMQATTSLNPQLQGAATNLSSQYAGAAGQPINFSGMPQPRSGQAARDAVTQSLLDRQMRVLQPKFEQEQSDLRTDLVNRGFSVGNEGYTKAENDLYQRQDLARQDAMDRALLAGGAEESRAFGVDMDARKQAISEMLLGRTQPLQELSALQTGFANFQPYSSTANAQGANYLGAMAAQFPAELQRYGLETDRSYKLHKGIMDIWGGMMGSVGG